LRAVTSPVTLRLLPDNFFDLSPS